MQKKNSHTIYYKIKIFVLSVRTEILAPLSNLTWDFLHYPNCTYVKCVKLDDDKANDYVQLRPLKSQTGKI
jgi:hypothetical protein